MTQSPNRPRSL